MIMYYYWFINCDKYTILVYSTEISVIEDTGCGFYGFFYIIFTGISVNKNSKTKIVGHIIISFSKEKTF